MEASEAIKSILAQQGKSKRSLALALGITAQAVDNRLSGHLRTDTLVQMADQLGYDVVLEPRGGSDGQIVLGGRPSSTHQ